MVRALTIAALTLLLLMIANEAVQLAVNVLTVAVWVDERGVSV